MKPPHCTKTACGEHAKSEPDCIDCEWRKQ